MNLKLFFYLDDESGRNESVNFIRHPLFTYWNSRILLVNYFLRLKLKKPDKNSPALLDQSATATLSNSQVNIRVFSPWEQIVSNGLPSLKRTQFDIRSSEEIIHTVILTRIE